MVARILDKGLVPIPEAAAEIGMSEKRLLGFCLSPLPWMPVAGKTAEGVMVYGWSLRGLPARAADTDTGAP